MFLEHYIGDEDKFGLCKNIVLNSDLQLIIVSKRKQIMALPNFQRFEVGSENNSIGLRWDKYISKLDNLFVGMNIDSKKRKKALLLHYAGDEVFDIYETLELGEIPTTTRRRQL